MNVELKRIAEKKIEQLGGDVCGVLVRKDGKLAAVDEHGRVQWLQSGHGAEPVAFAVYWGNGEVELHEAPMPALGDEPEGVTPLYTRPQPAVPEGEERLTDIYRRQLFECQDALNNLRSEYHNRTAELETEIEDLQAELQRVRRQPAVPDDLRKHIERMLELHEKRGVVLSVHLQELEELITTPTTPQADGWVRCSERLPKLGQRVQLFSQGVIQHMMPLFDDSDEGLFWDFEVHDYNPPVDMSRDQWRPLPQPPKEGA